MNEMNNTQKAIMLVDISLEKRRYLTYIAWFISRIRGFADEEILCNYDLENALQDSHIKELFPDLYQKLFEATSKMRSERSISRFWRLYDKILQQSLLKKIYEEGSFFKGNYCYPNKIKKKDNLDDIISYSEIISMEALDRYVKKFDWLTCKTYFLLARLHELKELHGITDGTAIFREIFK